MACRCSLVGYRALGVLPRGPGPACGSVCLGQRAVAIEPPATGSKKVAARPENQSSRWTLRYARVIDRTTRSRHAVWFGLFGIAISVSIIGCSSQHGASPTDNPQTFNQRVLRLPQSASPEDVITNLGKPVSEATSGSEATLIYHAWQLHFREGKLHQRVREIRTGRASLSGPLLDRKILFHLVPGATVRAVRKTLGTPEVYEQIYESARDPALILRYAYWELYFQNHRLVRRTKN